MHPILRIFPYQTDASLSVLGQCGSYDQGAVGSGRTPPATRCRRNLAGWSLQKIYKVTRLVGECADAVVYL